MKLDFTINLKMNSMYINADGKNRRPLRLSIKHLNHTLKTRYVLLYQKKAFY